MAEPSSEGRERIADGAILRSGGGAPPTIGADPVIRDGTIIYGDVEVGDDFTTGHHALVREDTTIGDNVLLGTQAVLDGECTVGDDVSIQTGAYIPRKTTIENRVFIGPNAVLTNDQYPLREERPLEGPVLEPDVSIGANATILPDVTIGRGAFVAANAVVTESIPPKTLAVGVPAVTTPLTEALAGRNEPR